MAIEYALLRYYPHIASDESMVIGVLTRDTDTAEVRMTALVSSDEIEVFDPEADGEFLESYMAGMDDEVAEAASQNFNMEEYIRYYVNDLRFDEMRSANVCYLYDLEEIIAEQVRGI